MSSISSVNQDLLLQQLSSQTGAGATQGTSQANDAFAALFQQILAGQASSSATGTTASAQSTSTASTASAQSSTSSDMNALSQALSAGNISAAQTAFQALQADLTGTQKSHHHHHHQDEDTTGQSATSTSTTAAASSADTTAAVAATTSTDGTASTTSNASQIMSLLLGMI
jgi:hypothetical protein